MALTITNTLTVINQGQGIIVEDTTVYGGSNPLRVDLKVYFTAQDMRTDPPTDIDLGDYVPATVTEVLVATPHDGWYQITQSYITNDEEVRDSLVKDTIVSERFCICKAKFANSILNKKCGCENASAIERLYCMNADFEGVKYLVSENDMKSADMAIERLNLVCALALKPC